MKSRLLLPNSFKKFGWIILIPSFILGFVNLFKLFNFYEFDFLKIKTFAFLSNELFGPKKSFSFIYNNITDELILLGIILGSILIIFSKEKIEDEYIMHIRHDSLFWSLLVQTFIVCFCTIFLFDEYFFYTMSFNLVGIFIIYICRFNFIIWKNSKGISNEK